MNHHSQSPLVSIITIVYNNRDHIEGTIQSVLSQTFKDYEYIIIDGASKDGTVDIIRKYEHNLGYWVSEKDKGIYDAMNKGLRAAKGKYVWFMNSGDKIAEPDTLEKIVNSAEGADVYYGETWMVNDEGKVLGTRTELSTRKLPSQLTPESMMYGMVVCHQSILVKRSIAPEFDLQYKCSADIDWVITSLERSKKTVNVKSILSRYLVGGFSIANQKLSWKERFNIIVNHFGTLKAWWAHFVIIVRALWYKVTRKANY